MIPEPSQRSARLIGLATLLCAPVLVYFAFRAQATNTNNVRDWLPRHFEATQRLKWYVERFGSDEVLVVSWDGCSVDDPRLPEFVERLSAPRPDSSQRRRHLFRKVLSGRSVLDRLTHDPLRLSRPEAQQRIEGWLVGRDGQTCVVGMVGLGPDGLYDRHAAVAAAETVLREMEIPDDAAYVAGPTADAVAIDKAGSQRVAVLGVAAAFWGAMLAWFCLRDALSAITVFLVAQLGWATSLSIVFWSGQNMDAVLMTMPALVFVLAISGAIHLTHYYQHARRTKPPRAAVATAIRAGWVPCGLACATTAVGLASLTISSVTPVVRFGTFAAIGTLAVFLILVFIWPTLTQLAGRWHRPLSPSVQAPWWDMIYRMAIRWWQPILVCVALGFPVLALGIGQLETSVRLSSLLPEGSRLIQSYKTLETRIGPIVPMEIVLEFSAAEDVRQMLDRSKLVESIRRRVDQMSPTGGTIAATTFAPNLPETSGARQVVIRTILAKKLAKHRPMFEQMGWIREHQGAELWRVSTRVATGDSVDYGQMLRRLDEVVTDGINQDPAFALSDVRHHVCGGVPLIYMAQQQLMNDLRRSFVVAFGLIAIVLALVLRSVGGGLLTMVPNLLPTLIVFGVMGLKRLPIDIGTMMTASVALGIAVDDTLHFLIWFRRGVERFGQRRLAIRFAFQNCATAMLHTSLICGLGMLPFVFSLFQPIARFAGVLCALLFAALLGDLIVLPALLASPLGRFAIKRRFPAESSANVTSPGTKQPMIQA